MDYFIIHQNKQQLPSNKQGEYSILFSIHSLIDRTTSFVHLRIYRTLTLTLSPSVPLSGPPQPLLLQCMYLIPHGAALKTQHLQRQLDEIDHRLLNLTCSHVEHGSAMFFSKWRYSSRLWTL